VDQREVVEKVRVVFERNLAEQQVKLSEIKPSNFEWLLDSVVTRLKIQDNLSFKQLGSKR
jgi:hypothetical protein